jgi:hypothetical protein
MRRNRLSIIFIVLLFASISIVSPVSSQEEQYPADINAQIIGDIPSVAISDWTEIEIEIKDAFGIDWGKFSLPVSEGGIPWWIMEIIWPLNPSFPQPVKRFLGPTSFKLEPEIVQGDSDGWYTKVSPSSIDGSVTGDNHSFTLLVQADDAYLDNSVVIGIKVTRIDTLGGVIGHSYVYVPVKASPTNFIKMRTLEESTKQAPLKSLVYFTLDIVNEGFYRDVFEFEIEEENGLMALMDQQAVTIHPGETKRVTLEILTPEKLYDFGTPNELKIYVRSSGDETKTLVGNLVVITKGIYISPLVGIIAAPIIALLIVGYIVFALYKDKQDKELYGKPDKPWNIPVEQKYLQELKEKDAEQYNKVMDMMKQEYQSALLYWKNIQQNRKGSFLSTKVFSPSKKESKKKDESIEKVESTSEENQKEGEKPFFKRSKKSKKTKEETKEKEDRKKVEKDEEEEKSSNKSFKESEKTSLQDKKKESSSNKLVNGLKKWFTVPEEEKQKKDGESVKTEKNEKEPEQKEVQSKELSEEKTKKDEDAYEQELKRIEEEQKKKQAKKAEQQKKLEKQKAIDRVKKAQEKQRKKLKK